MQEVISELVRRERQEHPRIGVRKLLYKIRGELT